MDWRGLWFLFPARAQKALHETTSPCHDTATQKVCGVLVGKGRGGRAAGGWGEVLVERAELGAVASVADLMGQVLALVPPPEEDEEEEGPPPEMAPDTDSDGSDVDSDVYSNSD